MYFRCFLSKFKILRACIKYLVGQNLSELRSIKTLLTTLAAPDMMFYNPLLHPLTPMCDQSRIFSLKFQYSIKQTSDENKEKYQLGDY